MRTRLYTYLFGLWLTDGHPLGHPVEALLYRAAMLIRPNKTWPEFTL